ncbi:MAG TPA: stage II sporulation protein M [Vicinamibacteria bacterium]
MKSVTFRREREAIWAELEALVQQIERTGLRGLLPSQAARLPTVYRATLSSLSVARAISLDANVLAYLESLASRAFVATYGAKTHPLAAAAAFLGRRFPEAVRAAWRQVALSALVMALGALTGYLLTRQDPGHFYALVSEDMAQGRGPSSTTAELRDILYHDKTAADLLTAFAMMLFTHNSQVGMLCFATGFAAGLPTLLLLFYNGVGLGAFGALYAGRGLGWEFWAWVLPHGVTELLAVVLCGAAGLVVAEALLFPGRHTRLENLALRGREAGVMVMGAVCLLLVAGLIEGIFRQVVDDVPTRLLVAAVSAAAWTVYFARTRGPRP